MLGPVPSTLQNFGPVNCHNDFIGQVLLCQSMTNGETEPQRRKVACQVAKSRARQHTWALTMPPGLYLPFSEPTKGCPCVGAHTSSPLPMASPHSLPSTDTSLDMVSVGSALPSLAHMARTGPPCCPTQQVPSEHLLFIWPSQKPWGC